MREKIEMRITANDEQIKLHENYIVNIMQELRFTINNNETYQKVIVSLLEMVKNIRDEYRCINQIKRENEMLKSFLD